MNLSKKAMCIFCTLQILTNLLKFTAWIDQISKEIRFIDR